MTEKWTKEAETAGVGDNVVCCNCGEHSVVGCGGEVCPGCNADGCLRWFDDDSPEIAADDDACVSVRITAPDGEYREFNVPKGAGAAAKLVATETRMFYRYRDSSNA